MIVVAGPPGSGKTSSFPVTAFGVDGFNIDDRCAQILGSYRVLEVDVEALDEIDEDACNLAACGSSEHDGLHFCDLPVDAGRVHTEGSKDVDHTIAQPRCDRIGRCR
jgi:hypothetical protein